VTRVNRRAILTALGVVGASGIIGAGYVLRSIFEPPTPGVRLTQGDGCMGGVGMADMRLYMDMFMRHREISRTVEEIPGGVRTTTQSNSPDLAAQLHTHVSSMYAHVDQGVEVTCMSQTLPTLF
jgi:hypothetical protein